MVSNPRQTWKLTIWDVWVSHAHALSNKRSFFSLFSLLECAISDEYDSSNFKVTFNALAIPTHASSAYFAIRIRHQQQHKMEVTQSTSSAGAPQHIDSANNNNNGINSRSTDRPRRGSFDPKSHALSKRPAAKPYRRQCDIYVSNKSNFKVWIIWHVRRYTYIVYIMHSVSLTFAYAFRANE